MSLDKRPVYRHKNIEKAFKNAEYFFVRYSSDCPICLSFFVDPQVLPCGHCYCNVCLLACIQYSRHCPLCHSFFWTHKPARFFFVEEIRDSILLRRCHAGKTAACFYEHPFGLEYFEESIFSNDSESINSEAINRDNCLINNSKGNNKGNRKPESKQNRPNDDIFYQSNDGQLYFLEPGIVRRMRSKPLYLYGRIKNKKECMIDGRHPGLLHIPSGTRIVIIQID